MVIIIFWFSVLPDGSRMGWLSVSLRRWLDPELIGKERLLPEDPGGLV